MTDTRKVTLSDRKIGFQGKSYLATFVGKQAVHTSWDGTTRVGTLAMSPGGRIFPNPHTNLIIRFEDGMWAKAHDVLHIVK